MSAPIKTTAYRLGQNLGKLPEENAVQRHKVFRQAIASIIGNVRLGNNTAERAMKPVAKRPWVPKTLMAGIL